MTFNLSPNWIEWARILKIIGGATTAVGVTLGGITPALAPLALVIPALAPAAGIVTAVGLLLHGIATGTKALSEALVVSGVALHNRP